MASVSAPDIFSLSNTLYDPNMNAQQPSIKLESHSLDEPTAVISDEDLYEDTGDLDYTGANQALMLTRIPKFLWESWTQLDDDDEIQLGTIKFEGSPEDPKRVCHPIEFSVWSRSHTPAKIQF